VSIDTSPYYRLTNGFLGEELALDLYPEAEGELHMSETSDSCGQFWKLVPLEDGKYAIFNAQLGDGVSLDVLSDGESDFLQMTPVENAAGQAWSLSPWGDGTYRLTTETTGDERFLDVRSDTYEPYFATGDSPGMHWTLTPVDTTSADMEEPASTAPQPTASRRAHRVPNAFFVAWGGFCLAALAGGSWMLVMGLQFRGSHRYAEATVAVEGGGNSRGARPQPHLQYEAEGKRYDIPAPPEPFRGKERQAYRDTYFAGNHIPVWYPLGNPQAASLEGDRGVLLGGITFTGAGVLFSLVGILAFIAEFFPNRYVRFSDG
jgi:hypothetical protein